MYYHLYCQYRVIYFPKAVWPGFSPPSNWRRRAQWRRIRPWQRIISGACSQAGLVQIELLYPTEKGSVSYIPRYDCQRVRSATDSGSGFPLFFGEGTGIDGSQWRVFRRNAGTSDGVTLLSPSLDRPPQRSAQSLVNEIISEAIVS
jgi:hypothetical protein